VELEKKIRGKIAILIVMAFALYTLFNYWTNIGEIFAKGYDLFFPFILGGCIAFIINIPVTFLSEKLSNCRVKLIGIIIRKYSIVISIVIS